MLRSEFDLLSEKRQRPTDEEYQLIEFVYNWHPCNFSKENVAAFYDAYGMAIFYDMEARSKAAMERDITINNIDAAIRKLQAQKYELQNKDDLMGRLENYD